MLSIDRNIYYKLGITSILIIPFFGLYDYLISLNLVDGVMSHSRRENPYRNLIVIKDLISLLILFILTLDFISTRKISKISLIILLLALFPFITCNSLGEFIAGVRESISLVYISLGYSIISNSENQFNTEKILLRITQSIKLVLIIELLLCLGQIYFKMDAHDGMTFFGPRVLGSFINPNTISMFALISIIFIHFFTEKKYFTIPYHFISIFIILASGSRGAVLGASFLYFFIFINCFKSNKFKVLAVIISIVALLIIILNINYISSKPSGISFFNDARVIAFIDYIESVKPLNFILGEGWGWNTSWYRAFYPVRELNYPADSFITSTLIQIGPFFLTIFITVLAFIFFLGGRKGLFLLLIFATIGLQINILEFYPIVNILFLCLGLLIGLERSLINDRFNKYI